MGRMAKIDQPQIFIIYEPSMFGSFLSNLFVIDKNFNGFKSDTHGPNAHASGFNDRLKNFHNHNDALNLKRMNAYDLTLFFQPLTNYKYSVHRLASYAFLDIEMEKIFSNYVKIICVPKHERLNSYAKRFTQTTDKKYKTQYWAKNFQNKNWSDVPEWFLVGMTVKEREKYLIDHMKYLKKYQKNLAHDFYFDPDAIADSNSLNKLVNKTCKKLNLKEIELPKKEITAFILKNQQFLPKNYK